ncbi:unnamed protein product [Meganyctiphanes norvegica]|uniref:EGF-like domain-containing protein n=1 Tax=Meganyctiphanes norvegica TaxID=48144 RepID=A0AAV2RGX3_MEGNR
MNNFNKMLELLVLLLSVSTPLIHAGPACTAQSCNTVQLSNPCIPSPCGPNTWCEVSPRHDNVAQCRCLDGFFPDEHTIRGCKPQCSRDDECPNDYRCQRTKCVRVCGPGACGINAICDADDHQSKCSCQRGYIGDPYRFCRRNMTSLPQVNDEYREPREDPCQPSPCGVNAQCRTHATSQRAICYCPHGYHGNPMQRCTRGECIESSECPRHLACQRMQCVNPCDIPNICGRGAECNTINHVPTCSCPHGFTGDPLTSCRRFDPKELCAPTPCGAHTSCKVENDRAVCSCLDGYIGNPLSACRPECVRHSDCPSRMACSANRCVNPCKDACGPDSYCDVRDDRAVCSCPMHYKGDPKLGCYPECLQHTDCPSFQACYQLECVDPCVGSCGTGAICRVENHYPICSCPKGYTGHPFDHCRPFTDADLCTPNPCGTNGVCKPGFDKNGERCPICSCPRGYIGNPLISCQRGDCETDSHCPRHQACHQYTCQDPCYHLGKSVCGMNANCLVRNQRPVCSCPRGYTGDARRECYRRGRNLSTHSIATTPQYRDIFFPAQTTMQPEVDITYSYVPAQTTNYVPVQTTIQSDGDITYSIVPDQTSIESDEDITTPPQTTIPRYIQPFVQPQ